MSSPTARKLVVCGGAGFIGSRICQHAVARGWDVTSISRSGEPKWEILTSSSSPPAWAHRVSWEQADILRPSTYTPLLRGASAVVHSMGLLLEANYKGFVSGQESPLVALRSILSGGPPPGSRPASGSYLDPSKLEADLVPPGTTPDQFTYELMNRDSALALARLFLREAETEAKAENNKKGKEHGAEQDQQRGGRPKQKTFVYISAAGGAPMLPARYLSTKREVENIVARDMSTLRSIFVRPSLVFDNSRPVTMGVAAAATMTTAVNGLTGGVFGGFLGSAGMKPLKADSIGQAVVEALDSGREGEQVNGVVGPPEIEELASRGWRKEML